MVWEQQREITKDRLGRKHPFKFIEYNINMDGCWECYSHQTNGSGYPHIRIKKKSLTVSRYVYETLFGLIPRNMEIRHKCDNRLCINPEHLLTGTRTDNMQDCINRGRSTRGERVPNHKLTSKEVIAIRESSQTGVKLSRQYGVGRMEISRIKRRLRWGWL